jgi:hypothetical protein
MGWTKHADALRLMDERRSVLRRTINKAARSQDRDWLLWLDAFEYEALDSALAHGNRDGVVASELGVRLNSKAARIDELVDQLLDVGPPAFTFRVE